MPAVLWGLTIPPMRRLLPALLFVAFTFHGEAQVGSFNSNLAAELNFETDQTGTMPRGWGGGPPGTIFVDGETVHSGRSSARLERKSDSPNGFSTITRAIPFDFAGDSIEWRGFLRT